MYAHGTAPKKKSSLYGGGKRGLDSSPKNPILAALQAILGFVGGLFALAAHGLIGLIRKSKAFAAVFALIVVLGVGCIVDAITHIDKVYEGVSIGEHDISGMTAEEVSSLVEATYTETIGSGQVIIFSNEFVAKRFGSSQTEETSQSEISAEQQSVEQARENKELWSVDSASLLVSLPADKIAAEALSVGRENGGLFARLKARIFGIEVPVHLEYGQSELEAIAHDIDMTIGDPRVDFDIEINEGVATVTEGHDGVMVNREWLCEQLDTAFLSPASKGRSFVAVTEDAPLRITRDMAQATCDQVNQALIPNALFTYNEHEWLVDASELGTWIRTDVVEDGNEGYFLNPSINIKVAKPALISNLQKQDTGKEIQVRFQVDGDSVKVLTDGTGQIALGEQALAALDAAWFNSYRSSVAKDTATNADSSQVVLGAGTQPTQVAVQTSAAPTEMTFEEALDIGVISAFSEYTTEFSNGSGTENRNENIRHAADLLDNSVCAANGGTWSFHETAGECSEETGFLPAGVIINGEYDTEFGGGICQVATTVFNAVYEAGLPIPVRYNHSLYTSAYPEGRDAAVSWPDLDLVWENDTPSDILLKTSHTETTVTVTLYGVDPGYTVETDAGEWSKGDEFEIRVKRDSSLEPNTHYIKVYGEDGRSIKIVRTVYDRNGEEVLSDSFYSKYIPLNQIVIAAPGVKIKDGIEAGEYHEEE